MSRMPTPAARQRSRRLFPVLLTSVALACGFPGVVSQAFGASPAEEGVTWQKLTNAQRQALAPLQGEWSKLDAQRKRKWLEIAGRYRKLPADERTRISERMTEWSRLTPSERGEVRMRYEETKQLPADDRYERWREYQRLSEEEKSRLAAQATSAASPAAKTQGGGVATAGRASAIEPAGHRKSNVVANPELVRSARPVAPTILQASPGATTHPITRHSTPPAHQQTGMPKIATSPEFVNRSTLLPKRGPQAAAVSLPGSAAASVTAPLNARLPAGTPRR